MAAARDAFDNGPWPNFQAPNGRINLPLSAKMKERMKDLARLGSLDSGGTIAKTGADAFLGQRQMNYFGTMAERYNWSRRNHGYVEAGSVFQLYNT